MLKASIFFIGAVFLQLAATAQDLEGEWKSFFTDSRSAVFESRINFTFVKINDSTFEGRSISIIEGKGYTNDTAICILRGHKTRKNVIYMEEVSVIKDFRSAKADDCKQRMELWYIKRKNKLILDGNWDGLNETCGFGKIHLMKKL